MPADMLDLEKEARFAMLEKLADYDDELMEQLLSDIEPPRDRVFADLTRELAEGLITPVLFGSAENGNGILRLLKALRHEAPGVAATAKRLGLAGGNGGSRRCRCSRPSTPPMAASCRSPACSPARSPTARRFYGGKGQDARIAGMFTLMGSTPQKIGKAEAGDTVALGKLENIATGETIVDRQGHDEAACSSSTSRRASMASPSRSRPQGRGEADQRHRQAYRGRSLAVA